MPFGLAEGLHWKAFIVGFATLLGCLLLMQIPSAAIVGGRYFRFISRAAGKLGITPPDIYRESVKIDLIRVIFGVLVIFRYAPIFAYAWTSGSPEQIAAGAGAILLAVFMAIGFATPLVAGLLTILVNPVIDTYLANPGIGSLVISMATLGFAILPAGTTLSLDAYLLKARLGSPIRLLYSLWGAPSLERAQVARLLPLLAYAAISACSALQHIHEPEWQAGEMVGLLLLLPLMNPSSYELFGAFSQRAPELYRYFSVIATNGMLFWQLLMIPMLLVNRYTRLLCIVWGIPFFIASEHILNIKMLGIFEYVLWALIFINIPGKVGKSSVTVFFDDHCNLCDQTVRTLSFLDIFRTVEFAPLSKNIERLHSHGVTEEEAQTDLVGVFDNAKVLKGYQLYLGLTTQLVLLLPLWPLLKAGSITGVGTAIYRYVAERRRRLFGFCERPKYRPRTTARASDSYGDGGGIAQAIAISFTVLLVCFLVRVPSLTGWITPGPVAKFIERTFGPAPLVYGMSKIDVFNKYDLEIYKHYVPFFVKEVDGKLTPATLMPQNETIRSTLTTAHRVISRQPVYCGARLVTETLRLLPPGHPYRAETLRANFYAIALPDSAAKTTSASESMFRLVCSVEGHLDSSGSARAQTVLSDFGKKLIRESFVDDQRVDGPWLDSVQNFPCAAESARLAYWFDHGNSAKLSQTQIEAVRDFLSESQVSEPMACLRIFAKMLPLVPRYHASDALAPGAEACAIDSSIAATLAGTVLFADQQPAARNAVVAARSGNFDECAKQSGAVRQAYFEKVTGTARFTASR